MSDLLPCPFCGGIAKIGDAEECGPNAYVVCCTTCFASSMVSFAIKEDARRKLIEAWNRRPGADRIAALQAEVARLREALATARCFVHDGDPEMQRLSLKAIDSALSTT